MLIIDTIQERLKRLGALQDEFWNSAALIRSAAEGTLDHSMDAPLEKALAELIAFIKGETKLGEANFPQESIVGPYGEDLIAIFKAQEWLLGDRLIEFKVAASILREGMRPEDYASDKAARVYMTDMTTGPQPKLTLYYKMGERYPKRVDRVEVEKYRAKYRP